jgi:hypothetical protein
LCLKNMFFFLLFFSALSAALLGQERYLPISETELSILEAASARQAQVSMARQVLVDSLMLELQAQQERTQKLLQVSGRQTRQLGGLSIYSKELLRSLDQTKTYLQRSQESFKLYANEATSCITDLTLRNTRLDEKLRFWRVATAVLSALLLALAAVIGILPRIRR